MALATYKEENLCCPICTEELKEPKSLPCCHGFCKECLHSYILSKTPVHEKRLSGFKCPVCRTFTAAPNQKSPLHQWANDFLTDFRFVSMLDTLPDDIRSPDSGSINCTCNQGHLAMFCQTHMQEICKTCASHTHRRCLVVSKNMVKTEFGKVLNKLHVLVQTLGKVKMDLERNDNNFDVARFRRSVVRNRQIRNNKVINSIQTTIDRIMDSHCLNLERNKAECQMAIDDARYQIKIAKSLGSQSTYQLRTSVDVLEVTLADLEERHRRLTRLPNSLNDIKTRAEAYISFAVSHLKPIDSSVEFEKKGSNIPNYFVLRLRESFDAKLPSDARNCLITGAVILTDGRLVLADTNNSNIKLFSSSFVFVNCINLLAPPFDVAETECNSIAVTFGKRNTIHFYEVNDKVPYEHTSVSTDQPCFGVTSGNDLLYVYCGNSWLNPACIKVYDYQQTLITKIFTDMFSKGEYLGYCPVSECLYVTSEELFTSQQLHCYPGDGDCKKLPGYTCRDMLGWTTGFIKGMVGIRSGIIMVIRNTRKSLGSLLSRSVIVFGEDRFIPNARLHTQLLLGADDAQFARIVVSNKQRTYLLVAQEAPFFMDKRNNQVKIFRISPR
ncbi:uncharacterized protein LOC117331433 [Pecten maximus]|uniref:uncharacterized protein LOC117331433 n=1 Tax=Pecten maximus TaxID=6579 RepID=UPI00145907F1|nr:uncharacterized protein LOC117331433 [Pecten maximus]